MLELAIFCIAGLVMLSDVVVSAMQFMDDCRGLLAMFFWLAVLAAWFAGVLLPAGWGMLTARLGRPGKRALAWSTAFTVVPPLLASVMNHPNAGHCIA